MKSGLVVEKTFDTLDEARSFRDGHHHAASLDVNEAAIFASRIKKRESKTYTFAQAIEDYRTEKTEKKKGKDSENCRLNKLARCKIAEMPLYVIHREELLILLDEIGASGTAAKGVKPKRSSTGNQKRYYNLVRHIFQVACDEWKKVDKNPCSELAASDIPIDCKPRDRRFKDDEYVKLLKELKGQARVVMILAVETAMRRGEILALEWQYVDLKQQTAFLPVTKNSESRMVPLSSRAVSAIRELPIGIKGKVFAIGADALRYQWRAARTNIGSPDLRIHDLRHEGASRLFEKGLNVMEASAVTGHKTLGMLKRYTHLNPSELAKKLG
ncbi:MAG: site-specific integrase [Burkholderiales bacterium]